MVIMKKLVKTFILIFAVTLISVFTSILRNSDFAYAATVTSIEPQQPKIGDTVTVRGSNFGANKSLGKICVGSSCYISATTWSQVEITFYIPSYVSPGTLSIEPYCSYNSACEPGVWYGPTVVARGGIYVIDTKPPIYPGSEITISTTGYSTYFTDFGSAQGSVTIGGYQANIKQWLSSRITLQVPKNLSSGQYSLLVTAQGIIFEPITLNLQKLPTFTAITPDRDIVRGITRVRLQGSGFGTEFCARCDIFVGSISIEKGIWSDTEISFVIPNEAPPVGQIRLAFNGAEIGSLYYSTTANYAEKTANTNDPLVAKQYYLSNIGAIAGWSLQNTGNIVVAVLDDGIYLNHPDLNGAIWSNTKEVAGNKKDDDGNGITDDIYGYNFVSNVSEMTPTGSHGTEVGGIIGAIKNNGIGIAGIASGVKLMPVIVCSSTGCPIEAVINGIKYAVDNGARVINLSLGGFGFNDYSADYDDAIRYASSKNVVIVAAAGNGDEVGTSIAVNTTKFPVSPVCNDIDGNTVLGVSGTNEVGAIPSWVNYGKCADVYSPATDIFTTTVPNSNNPQTYYKYNRGTSFSSPMVAAIAAMMISKNPSLSAQQVIDTIIKTAEKKLVGNQGATILLAKMDKTLSENIISAQISSTPTSNNELRYRGLPSGAVTSEDLSAVFTRSLSQGMRGNDVKVLQEILYKMGYLKTKPTGYFGPATHRAVVNFQAENDIPTVGVFGPKTRAVLLSSLADNQ